MYYVVYVERETGRERAKSFNTRNEAVDFYKRNLRNMSYGYISDDEALEVADEVKKVYEEEMEMRLREAMYRLFG